MTSAGTDVGSSVVVPRPYQIFVAEKLDNAPARQRNRSAQDPLDDEERELVAPVATDGWWGPVARTELDGARDDAGGGRSGLLRVESLPKVGLSLEQTDRGSLAKAHPGLA